MASHLISLQVPIALTLILIILCGPIDRDYAKLLKERKYIKLYEVFLMVLRKIISGGQTGADQAGLHVGRTMGLETGGTAPKGFRTERGNNPALKNYGLVETESSGYKRRTICNIEEADGTVIFGNLDSLGSRFTISEAVRREKPLLVNPTPQATAAWIEQNKIEVMNVAGNRYSKNPSLYAEVVAVLTTAIDILRKKSDVVAQTRNSHEHQTL